MKINIYLNDVFYKSMDLGVQERYDPRTFTDMIAKQRKDGTLDPKFKIEKGMNIRVEKVE